MSLVDWIIGDQHIPIGQLDYRRTVDFHWSIGSHDIGRLPLASLIIEDQQIAIGRLNYLRLVEYHWSSGSTFHADLIRNH